MLSNPTILSFGKGAEVAYTTALVTNWSRIKAGKLKDYAPKIKNTFKIAVAQLKDCATFLLRQDCQTIFLLT